MGGGEASQIPRLSFSGCCDLEPVPYLSTFRFLHLGIIIPVLQGGCED